MLLGRKAWRSAVCDSHEDQRLAQIIAFQLFRRWVIVREPNGVPMGLAQRRAGDWQRRRWVCRGYDAIPDLGRAVNR